MYTLLSTLLGAALTASVLASPIDVHERHPKGIKNGQALYFITNEAKNSVAAIGIKPDGTLADAKLTSTGGSGAAGVDATGKSAGPDALFSQSALTVAGQYVFAVNPGSNTVSMLETSSRDWCSLKLVGKPAALPGTFPVTVSASLKNSLVCVGTSGSKAGISCANFDKNGIGKMDALRPFDLGQRDPPVGPTNTVSQTFFSDDESTLFTTVKGDPPTNKTGFLSAFAVASSQRNKAATLSTNDVRSSPSGTAVLFGSQPIAGSNPPELFVTDASFGGAVLSVDRSLSSHLVAKQTIDGQKATCWATISPLTKTAFVTDVATNRIVEMSLKDASIVDIIDLRKNPASAADPGLIDLKAAGGFVYALSPGNGTSEAAISVVDAKSKKLVQHAKLGAIGIGSTAQGMAVLL